LPEKFSTVSFSVKLFRYNSLTPSFPHFHRVVEKGACGNVENFVKERVFHRHEKFSTAFSTGAVENNSFSDNNKPTFPHFHRPYYYYYIYI
jgi:hypothetical protein